MVEMHVCATKLPAEPVPLLCAFVSHPGERALHADFLSATQHACPQPRMAVAGFPACFAAGIDANIDRSAFPMFSRCCAIARALSAPSPR